MCHFFVLYKLQLVENSSMMWRMGFELRIYGVGSERSTNTANTTAKQLQVFRILSTHFPKNESIH